MIERRPFGRTRHQSTVTLFGGAALARATQDEADRTLEVLLSYGVNHIDTASRYGDSELRIGPWMARHRKDFFLATKTGMRGAREAREDLHRSLERLRVDSVDLIQLHSLGHPPVRHPRGSAVLGVFRQTAPVHGKKIGDPTERPLDLPIDVGPGYHAAELADSLFCVRKSARTSLGALPSSCAT